MYVYYVHTYMYNNIIILMIINALTRYDYPRQPLLFE